MRRNLNQPIQPIAQSKVDVLQKHVSVIQTQIATLSLNVISLQSQIKEIERIIKDTTKPKSSETIPTPIDDVKPVSSDLNIDDDSSEGYDTDDNPLHTHRVKTRIPRIKTARKEFVFVPNYALPQPSDETEDDSGYEDSD